MKKLFDVARDLDSQATTIRKEAARALRAQGMTYAQIALELGISRARAHELCAEEPAAKEASA